MAKVKMDLAGKVFGHLTAIEPVARTPGGQAVWRCECDCGNTQFQTTRSHLLSGSTSSCGCRQGAYRDITGQRFGKLVAKKPVGPDKKGSMRWRCVCDCGNSNFITTGANLIHNGTVDCGCVAALKENEFLSKQYGYLKAIRPVPPPEGIKKKESFYLCECKCGNTTVVSRSNLVVGNTKSCGCLRLALCVGKLGDNSFAGTNVGAIASLTLHKNNKTGVRGVYEQKGRYYAQINFQKTKFYLGSYGKLEEAAAIRHQAEENLFGPFLDWYEATIGPLPKRSGKKPKPICMEETK